MSLVADGRDINDLRVVDLRAELDKRGLDKSGNKQVLLERLQKAIDEESHLIVKDEVGILSDIIPENGVDDLKDMKDNKETDDMPDSAVLKKEPEDPDTDTKIVKLDTNDSEDIEGEDDVEEPTEAACVKRDKDLSLHDDADGDCATDEKNASVKKEEDSKETSSEVVAKVEHQAKAKVETKPTAGATNGNDTSKKTVAKDTKLAASKDEQHTEKEKVKKESPSSAEQLKDKALAGTMGSKDGKSGDKATAAASTSSSSTSPSKIKDRLANDQNRNLWITNISQTTRATELKQALSEHGKVVGAKVVMNARHPAACCYGYVRMETVADADNCIAKLNNTELNGQIIRIEKVRPDHLCPTTNTPTGSTKNSSKTDAKEKPSQKTPVRAPTPAKNSEDAAKKERKPIEAPKDDAKEKTTKSEEKPTKEAAKDDKREKRKEKTRSRSRERTSSTTRRRSRSRSRDRTARADRAPPPRKEMPMVRKEKDILTFDKIKSERERERLREREREMRMRRREDAESYKEVVRRRRTEEIALERERQKLKEVRERLERERAEVLALERERQKREREKIELERQELERAKLRMQEEDRRAVKRPAPASNYRERERSYETERKRPVSNRHFEEAPPPPRFDGSASIKARVASPAIKKYPSTSTASKEYGKTGGTVAGSGRMTYEKRDAYVPKRDYDELAQHTSSAMRSSSTAMTKYDNSSTTYSRDRDMRTENDASRSRNSGPAGISSAAVSKYGTSDSKGRYSERSERSPHFSSRSMRDERGNGSSSGVRRSLPEPSKSDMRSSRDHRYPEPKAEAVRYDRTTSSASSWSQQKSFVPTNSGSSGSKPWNKESWRTDGAPSSSDRWTGSTSRGGGSVSMSSSGFSTSTGMGMGGTSCPPPPGINNYVNDRFDYKSGISTMRKY